MELAFWRNLAITWLSLFCIIGLVIPLVIGYFAVRGMRLATGKIRPLLQKGRGYSQTLRQQSENASNRVSEPLLRLRHRATKAEATLRSVLPVRKKQFQKS